jgi:hypothetical protein
MMERKPCHPEENSMDRPLPAAFALALLAAPAFAVDYPTMKAGLWESRLVQEGAPTKAGATRICMNAAVQKEMLDMTMGSMKSMCTKNDIRRDGNRLYGTAECKLGESAMKSSSVTTFAGDSAYRTEVKSAFDPPLMGKATSTTLIEGKWMGACPAGMQPGDITMPDGRKMNMLDMRGAMGSAK